MMIKFFITHPGEAGAGIRAYTNRVFISADYDVGGEEGEFESYMKDSLKEWFDGAFVYTEKEAYDLEK